MGNNNLKDTNNILVKADQNNLIYIDPNSTMSNGKAESRSVEPENLVMYVNLEADLIPRTTLVSDGNQDSLTSIAGGTLNFLRNKNGQDFDTTWTDAYTDVTKNIFEGESKQNDSTAQSFGINNVSIEVKGANFIPRVVINFTDVRGKTLFESPTDSPYGAFFHLPWPIFYLTVKGYYGKAIKYRLHLVKFNTKFNSDNGNMEVETQFVGSTYAYMSDISLESILNAPYFYKSEAQTTRRKNPKNGKTEVVVSKSTKGYRVLKSVYQEYRDKGLLPKDFPIKTLREIIVIAHSLNKTLEKEIFDKVVDPKILAGVKDFEDLMQTFEGGLTAWNKRYMSPEYFTTAQVRKNEVTQEDEPIRWFKLSQKEPSLDRIVGETKAGTLEHLISTSVKQLASNTTFGKERDEKLIKDDKLTISPISFTMLENIEDFYISNPTFGIDLDGLELAIHTVYRNFIEQRNKLESDIESHMNEIVKTSDIGIGFEPTIRNIIGVVLANADTYVRLMKDVHTKAFESAIPRKKILSNVITDSDDPKECIYPWPEVKVQTAGDRSLVLKYPGSREMIGKLKSDNKSLWPEVDFVENFYEISTKKIDPFSGEEGGDNDVDYVFDTQSSTNKEDISVLTNIMGVIPFSDKSFTSVLYEIYERAKYTTSFSPFSNAVMQELANAEFDNIVEHLSEDIDITEMLKENIKSYEDLLEYMKSLSTYERFPYFLDQLPTVWYMKEILNQDFNVSEYKSTDNSATRDNKYPKLTEFLNGDFKEEYRNKIYPFNSTRYEEYLGHSFATKDLQLNGMLTVNTPNNFIISPIDPTMWVKDGFTDNLFNDTINFGFANMDTYRKHILHTILPQTTL